MEMCHCVLIAPNKLMTEGVLIVDHGHLTYNLKISYTPVSVEHLLSTYVRS